MAAQGYIRFYSTSVPGTSSARRLLQKMRGSKQLLVYVCIVNIPLVKHGRYSTNCPYLFTDFCGCIYSVSGLIFYFLYGSFLGQGALCLAVTVLPSECLSQSGFIVQGRWIFSKTKQNKTKQTNKQKKPNPTQPKPKKPPQKNKKPTPHLPIFLLIFILSHLSYIDFIFFFPPLFF